MAQYRDRDTLIDDVAAVALDGPAQAPSERRGARAVALAVAALLLAGLVTAVLRWPGESPQGALDAIVAFVEDQPTAHVAGTVEWSTVDGEDGLGQRFSQRSSLEGDLRLPTDSRVVLRSGDGVMEAIVLGRSAYSRSADDESSLQDEEWIAVDLDEEAAEAKEHAAQVDEEDGANTDVADMLGQVSAIGASFGDSPIGDMRKLLASLEAPVRRSDGVLEVRLALYDFIASMVDEAAVADVDRADVEGTVTFALTPGPGGRLDRLRVEVEQVDGSSRMVSTTDLRFTSWGGPVSIAAPGPDAVDHTPSFDERQVASAPFAVLAPRNPPAGIALTGATWYQGSEDDETCSDVTLRYADPAAERAAWDSPDAMVRSIDIVVTDAACTFEDAWDEDDSELGEPAPIVLGDRRGTIVRYVDPDYGPSIIIVVEIDGSRHEISADLPEADVLAALSDLVPLDLSTQPVHEVAAD